MDCQQLTPPHHNYSKTLAQVIWRTVIYFKRVTLTRGRRVCFGSKVSTLQMAPARDMTSPSTSQEDQLLQVKHNLINRSLPLRAINRMAHSAPPLPPFTCKQVIRFSVPVGVLHLQLTRDKTAAYRVWIRCRCPWTSGIHPGSRSHVHRESHKPVCMRDYLFFLFFFFKCGPH